MSDQIHLEKPIETLTDGAILILQTADPDKKSFLTDIIGEMWKKRDIKNIGNCTLVPDHPARPENVKVLAPHLIPKRGKAGSMESRISMIHALVNIESWAIDLSWDIIARYTHENMPESFYDDWVKVATDEAKHYRMLNKRLRDLGSFYGALPTHEGLWSDATHTSKSLLARLAIEHIVQEGRGLDATPKTIARFETANDRESVTLLNIILTDEITHVTAGMKWFTFLCERNSIEPMQIFYDTVKTYFRGNLKPPFNQVARTQAGMTEQWYMPLIDIKRDSKPETIPTE